VFFEARMFVTSFREKGRDKKEELGFWEVKRRDGG